MPLSERQGRDCHLQYAVAQEALDLLSVGSGQGFAKSVDELATEYAAENDNGQPSYL
jgi:hypothetical protein